MSVDLTGDAFLIARVSPRDIGEQLVAPTACWQFDVVPRKAGRQILTVSVAFRIPIPNRPDERRAIKARDDVIVVDVDHWYAIRAFATANWAWILTAIGTIIALITLLSTLWR